MQRIDVIIGAYNLMPEGTEEASFEETYQVCWRPFLSVLYRFPDIASVLHYSGTVLRWLESRHPEFLMLLKEMSARKQIELLGGGYFSPLMHLIPGADRLGQVEMLTTHLRRTFSKRPRGCWLTDYAWEPSLASSLQACGFDYTFLPERHFPPAGSVSEDLGSPAITEDQGRSLLVFPVFDALESLPFPQPFAEAISAIASKNAGQRLFSFFFPGEWARDLWTYSKLETPDLFFEKSFTALQKEALRFETTTPSRYLKGPRDFRRAYFPGSGSARLMEKSSLSSSRKGEALAPGSPRRILLRHWESLALYAKMHYVRILISQLRGDKSRKKTAQEELWRGQCGGAYWPCLGGGIARLPVRAAAYSALIEAEKITRQRGSFSPGVISADIDFDGGKEILYQGADINAYVQLRGACLFELDSLKTRTNYINVMNGSPDEPRRLCFRDRLSERGSFGLDKGGFADARYLPAEAERPSSVASLMREGFADIGGKKRSISIRKTYSFRKGGLSVDYEIANRDPYGMPLRLGVEFNLSAGLGPDLVGLFGIRSREEIALETDRKSLESDLNGLRLSNLAKDETIELRSDLPFCLSHSPVISDCRSDLKDAQYQGCLLLLGWDLEIPADSSRRVSVTLELRY